MTKNLDNSKPGFHISEVYAEVKWLTGFEHGFIFDSRFRKHALMKRWCEENCEDTVCFFRTQSKTYSYKESIYFILEEDAVAFKLQWGDFLEDD